MTTTYAIGEEKYIYRSNGSGKTYICIGIGEHCYIWMDKNMKADYDAAGKTSLIASDMASIYDRQPYQILKTLAGGDLPWERWIRQAFDCAGNLKWCKRSVSI